MSVLSACFTASSNSFFSSAPGNFISGVDTDVDAGAGFFTTDGATPGFVLPAKCSPPLKRIYVTVANDVLLKTGSNTVISPNAFFIFIYNISHSNIKLMYNSKFSFFHHCKMSYSYIF